MQFLVVFAVGRGSTVLGLQRQQPSEQDGLSASLHSFQSHRTLDVLCANKYANDFAGGHWTTLPLFFLSMAELGKMWIVAVKVHFSFFSFTSIYALHEGGQHNLCIHTLRLQINTSIIGKEQQ